MIRKYAEIFCWKNVSSFCSAKATHIFSAKNIRILCIESAKTVNEMTLNELVKLTMLWTTGPWSLGVWDNESLLYMYVDTPSNLKQCKTVPLDIVDLIGLLCSEKVSVTHLLPFNHALGTELCGRSLIWMRPNKQKCPFRVTLPYLLFVLRFYGPINPRGHVECGQFT